MFSDCHAHLDLFPGEEVDRIVEEGEESDVGLIIAASVNGASSHKTLKVAKRYETIHAAVGIHPRIVHEVDDAEIQEVLDLAQRSEVSAISEVGLDYRENPEAKDKQIDLLRRALKAGVESDKPLIIHMLDAFDDAVRIIDEYPDSRGAVHCFSGNLGHARALADRNFYPSISNGVLSDPPMIKREIMTQLELESMVIDTDTLPGTFEVRHAADIAGVIAEHRGISAEEVGEATTRNLRRLLGG